MAKQDEVVDVGTGEVTQREVARTGLSPGIKPKTVAVQYGGKLNLGDYNSAEVGASIWADVELGRADLTVADALAELRQTAVDEVREQALRLSAPSARMALAQIAQRVRAVPEYAVLQDESGALYVYRAVLDLDPDTAADMLRQEQDPAVALVADARSAREGELELRTHALATILYQVPQLADLAADLLVEALGELVDAADPLGADVGVLLQAMASGTYWEDGQRYEDYTELVAEAEAEVAAAEDAAAQAAADAAEAQLETLRDEQAAAGATDAEVAAEDWDRDGYEDGPEAGDAYGPDGMLIRETEDEVLEGED